MNAVVFAYHDVGVRCLKVLLARGVQVSLVVTHEDNAAENIWFGSVAGVCREHGITCITPTDPKSPQLLAQVQAAQPDFIFSFYYRHMLPAEVLATARRGAYNMHGSLLPKYRGRVPINWAVLHGETETGATLHEMTVKPDAGSIVAQTAVPILPDDTAHEVFGKVVVAAEMTLWTALPAMLAGRTPQLPNDLSKGSYFSGRKPEDGRIDWRRTAREVHNLVRAVAPPYPGAFEEIAGDKITVTRTRLVPPSAHPALQRAHGMQDKFFEGGKLYARCGDGNFLQILGIQINDQDASLNNYLKYMAS
ncbi:formyltransferase [Herbaspirillum frisingense GSF30]|uniref:Formyltransferase n=1 Tax=Herbaspirillum frisingense GSF30 TaxID=864073 RepID=A0AAI9N4H0_9BURK|nr:MULTISPECIES: formyltransferase [Herbaspirillum]EOA05528.1 formyltransferase [Herbaspirillum frisingense GSF30]MCI1014757.1 formyltransferase [Herbaspirillum sp. C7C2]